MKKPTRPLTGRSPIPSITGLYDTNDTFAEIQFVIAIANVKQAS